MSRGAVAPVLQVTVGLVYHDSDAGSPCGTVGMVYHDLFCSGTVFAVEYDSDSGVSCGPVVCLVLQLVWCSMLLVLVLLLNRVV